ncbi:hypothetical protein AQJ91_12270 [Streptomyces dysideae]|uniref:Uncharacterized protein n=1 Tax=Streptomyces dysideae TaxID=909626 RepID=A0A101V1D6_9ACTN|nr:hypothetical protein AQJ91_12270 [Streptomyces dysideae]
MRSFVGREAELEAISRSLTDRALCETNLVSLVGMPGVGKTSLAVRWAVQNAECFPDGIYFLGSRVAWGSSPMISKRPLIAMLRLLGIPVEPVWSCSTMQAVLREAIQNRQMLVILDDVPSAAAVRSVLPALGTASVLVTSRRRMDGLVATHGVRQFVVPTLQRDESAQLVAMMGLGEEAEAHRGVAERIIKGCAGHPLALRIASVASFHCPDLFRHCDVGTLVMCEEDYTLRSLFQHEYSRLPAEAADLFRYLAENGGKSLTVDEISTGFGVPESEVAHGLGLLHNCGFVQWVGHGAYETHCIARAFARTLVADKDS